MNINIFEKNNVILNPFGIESLYHLATFIKDKNNDINYYELKDILLDIFQYLINNDIVFVLKPNYI